MPVEQLAKQVCNYKQVSKGISGEAFSKNGDSVLFMGGSAVAISERKLVHGNYADRVGKYVSLRHDGNESSVIFHDGRES